MISNSAGTSDVRSEPESSGMRHVRQPRKFLVKTRTSLLLALLTSGMGATATAQELSATLPEPLGVVTGIAAPANLKHSVEFVQRRVTEDEFTQLQATGWTILTAFAQPEMERQTVVFREVIAMQRPRLERIFDDGFQVQFGPERAIVLPLLDEVERVERMAWLRQRKETLKFNLTEQEETRARLLVREKPNDANESALLQRELREAERGFRALLELRLRYDIEMVVLTPPVPKSAK